MPLRTAQLTTVRLLGSELVAAAGTDEFSLALTHVGQLGSAVRVVRPALHHQLQQCQWELTLDGELVTDPAALSRCGATVTIEQCSDGARGFAAIGALFIAGGAKLAVGAAVGSVASIVGTALVGYGISTVVGGIARLLMPTPSAEDPQKVWQGPRNIDSFEAPIPYACGEALISGVSVSTEVGAYDLTDDDSDEFLLMLIALCDGPVHGITTSDIKQSIYINGQQATTDSGGVSVKLDYAHFTDGTTALDVEDFYHGREQIQINQTAGGVKTNGFRDGTSSTSYDVSRTFPVHHIWVRVDIPQCWAIDNDGRRKGKLQPFKIGYVLTLTNAAGVAFYTSPEWFYQGPTRTLKYQRRKISIPSAHRNSDFTVTLRFKTLRQTRGGAWKDLKAELRLANILIIGTRRQITYKGTSMLALKIPAGSLVTGGIPQVAVKGKWRTTKIPSICTVAADGGLNYSSTSWDGTMTTARYWHSNPAWLLYDMFEDERVASFVDDAFLDVYKLYEIGRRCDELINGKRRYSWNGQLTHSGPILQLFTELLGSIDCQLYAANNAFDIVQDKSRDINAPDHIFCPANVIDGVFQWETTAISGRHASARVVYNDTDNDYELTEDIVEHADAIAAQAGRYKRLQIAPYLCNSREQAIRAGRSALYSEVLNDELVTFTTGLAGAAVQPGDLLLIADPWRLGSVGGHNPAIGEPGYSGRAEMNVSRSERIGLNKSVPTDVDSSSYAFVTLSTGAVGRYQVDTVVNRSAGWLELGGGFDTWSNPLQPDGPAYLEVAAHPAPRAVVVGIKQDDRYRYTITAVIYKPEKYTAIDSTSFPASLYDSSDTTFLTGNRHSVLPAPSNLLIDERIIMRAQNLLNQVTISWDQVEGGSSYIVRYETEDHEPVTVTVTTSSHVIYRDPEEAQTAWTVTVQALDPVSGALSPVVSATHDITGQTAPPIIITGLTVTYGAAQVDGRLLLTWDSLQLPEDLDVQLAGQIVIYRAPVGTPTTGTWTEVVRVAGSQTSVWLDEPSTRQDYRARARDPGNRTSPWSAAATVRYLATAPAAVSGLAVVAIPGADMAQLTWDEHPSAGVRAGGSITVTSRAYGTTGGWHTVVVLPGSAVSCQLTVSDADTVDLDYTLIASSATGQIGTRSSAVRFTVTVPSAPDGRVWDHTPSGLQIRWNEVDAERVRNGGHIEVQAGNSADHSSVGLTRLLPGTATFVIIPYIDLDVASDRGRGAIRLRAVDRQDRESSWTSVTLQGQSSGSGTRQSDSDTGSFYLPLRNNKWPANTGYASSNPFAPVVHQDIALDKHVQPLYLGTRNVKARFKFTSPSVINVGVEGDVRYYQWDLPLSTANASRWSAVISRSTFVFVHWMLTTTAAGTSPYVDGLQVEQTGLQPVWFEALGTPAWHTGSFVYGTSYLTIRMTHRYWVSIPTDAVGKTPALTPLPTASTDFYLRYRLTDGRTASNWFTIHYNTGEDWPTS